MSRESLMTLIEQVVTEIRASTSTIPCDITGKKCSDCAYKHGGAACSLLMIASIGEIVLEDNKWWVKNDHP